MCRPSQNPFGRPPADLETLGGWMASLSHKIMETSPITRSLCINRMFCSRNERDTG